jgi:hypothetical protein
MRILGGGASNDEAIDTSLYDEFDHTVKSSKVGAA